MLIFGITKLINKTLAPKLLSLGLRLHDITPSSSSSGLIMPLLLPLAQKLVSIEVRDDYRNLARSMMTMMQGEDGGGGGRGGGGAGGRRTGTTVAAATTTTATTTTAKARRPSNRTGSGG